MYKLELTTVTPFLQIEESGKDFRTGAPKLFAKRKECVVDGKIGRYPFLSGGEYRGLKHREVADIVFAKAIEKGIKLDPTNVHILQAGGGSNFQEQPIDVALKVRELNPIVSVYGVSLAIEGKLMVSDFEPTDKMFTEVKDKDILMSRLIQTQSYIKKDELLASPNTNRYGRVLSVDDLLAYQEENKDVQEQRKSEREDKASTTKTKKLGIQAYNIREYVIPGTKFVGYIGAKWDFTDLEKGMLLVGMERMLKRQLGSSHNVGFGVMEQSIQKVDETGMLEIMSASKNEKDIFSPITELKLTAEERRCVDVFYDWLENITEENVLLSKTLYASKK